jgi:hypothetical protein
MSSIPSSRTFVPSSFILFILLPPRTITRSPKLKGVGEPIPLRVLDYFLKELVYSGENRLNFDLII